MSQLQSWLFFIFQGEIRAIFPIYIAIIAILFKYSQIKLIISLKSSKKLHGICETI